MNYYEHHLGDWAAATGHLTWDEDMAYTRLLRAYYHAERAIPQGQQYRIARAATPAQRKAVDAVLAEFFILVDGNHHQKRADAEIARFQDKQRKAKASADARWSQSGRNANASPDAMRTHSEGNAPRHQTPDTRPKERGDTPLKPPPWSPPEWVPAEPWANFVLHRKAMRGVPFTDAARDGVVSELRKLADAGHDPAELLVTAVTRGWRTVFPPRANGASQPVGAMSEHGMQTMRNANALKARIFKEESHEA